MDPPFLLPLRQKHKDFNFNAEPEVDAGGGSSSRRVLPELAEDAADSFDLHFVCSDGIVSAHRLFIANVSKYIMSMLDDQPPWYPIHVHIPDLPKSLVQILVDLAYTGEMRFPSELQEDVIDAMQTLGWVHTDSLSADFCESGVVHDGGRGVGVVVDEKEMNGDKKKGDIQKNEGPEKENDCGNKDGKIGEETVVVVVGVNDMEKVSPMKDGGGGKADEEESAAELKLSFPALSTTVQQQQQRPESPRKARGSTSSSFTAGRTSFNEEDDESMEISELPEMDMSDSEDASVFGTNMHRIPGKEGLPNGYLDKSAQDSNNLNDDNKSETHAEITPPKTPIQTVQQQGLSPQIPKDSEAMQELVIEENLAKTPIKRTRKTLKSSGDSETESVAPSSSTETLNTVVEDGSQASNASESSNVPDSPGKRQRRKPKRFEEFEETVGTGRTKTSPVKTDDSLTPKKGKGKLNVQPVKAKESIFDSVQKNVEKAEVMGKELLDVPCSGESVVEIESLEKTPPNMTTSTKTRGKKAQTPRKTLTVGTIADADDIVEVEQVDKVAAKSSSENGNPAVTNKKVASKTPSKAKKRLSAENPKNSLITSFFAKKDVKLEEGQPSGDVKEVEIVGNQTTENKKESVESSTVPEPKKVTVEKAGIPALRKGRPNKAGTDDSTTTKGLDVNTTVEGNPKGRKSRRLSTASTNNTTESPMDNPGTSVKKPKAIGKKASAATTSLPDEGVNKETVDSSSAISEAKKRQRKRILEEDKDDKTTQATGTDQIMKPIGKSTPATPVRKSSRVAKAAKEDVLVEEESSKPEIGADAPQRKRARKDTTDTPLTPAKVVAESGSGIITRRSSKND